MAIKSSHILPISRHSRKPIHSALWKIIDLYIPFFIETYVTTLDIFLEINCELIKLI